MNKPTVVSFILKHTAVYHIFSERAIWLRKGSYAAYLQVTYRKLEKSTADWKEHVKAAEKICYDFTTGFIFTSKRILSVAINVVLFATQTNSVVYKYKCHCNKWFVEQTTQCIHDPIEQFFS